MKPLNFKERKKELIKFYLVFAVLILAVFLSGFLTLKTGEFGVDVLGKKHAEFTESFRIKATLTHDLDEIIKRLSQINNRERNLGEHKKYQDLISEIRNKMTTTINAAKKPEEFVLYSELITIIKDIQSDLDNYKEDHENYYYIEELLERCKEKYIEERRRK